MFAKIVFTLKFKLELLIYSREKLKKTKSDIKILYNKISYVFKNEDYLMTALKHRSYLVYSREDRLESNERLEFLGDSIISFIVTRYLYDKFPKESEGELTKIKSFLVSGENLSNVANSIDLGNYILISDSEEKTGGRHKMSLLEDTFEALVGAIFLDGGLRAAKKFVKSFLLSDISKDACKNFIKNYKSELLEFIQSFGFNPPYYKIVDESGPEHKKIFMVAVYVNGRQICTGSDLSKKKAEQNASKDALLLLKDNIDIIKNQI